MLKEIQKRANILENNSIKIDLHIFLIYHEINHEINLKPFIHQFSEPQIDNEA